MTNSIFSPDEVNISRQPELDLLKAVTIFTMIFLHVAEVAFSNKWEDMAYCNMTPCWMFAIFFFNMFTAFGFMFSMGASIPFSHHQGGGFWIKRGFKLILAWFVLKLFYVYPLVCLFANAEKRSRLEFCLDITLCSDILFFAGAFFIFIGCLRKMKIGLAGTILTAVGLFTLGHFISYDPSSKLMQHFLGNFITTTEASFPFLNWIMAPILGMCWGRMLRHCADKDRLYLRTGLVGLIASGAILLILGMKGQLSQDEIQKHCDVVFFYDANFLTVTVSCCFFALLLSLYYAVVRIVKANWFVAGYSYFSKQLTNIYFAQWVIIPWMAFCLPRPTEKVNMWWVVPITIFIFCLSAFFAEIYVRIKKGQQNSADRKKTE